VNPTDLLKSAALDLARQLPAGYLVTFDFGAHVRGAEVWFTGSLNVYTDVRPLRAVVQFFASEYEDKEHKIAPKLIAQATEWLAVGRSLAGSEAA
jgi:hypothetical protein